MTIVTRGSRPFYELYDLERDPAELDNLAGQPQVAGVERELRAQLIRKMIGDFDYLPLPSMAPSDPQGTPTKSAGTKTKSKKKQRPSS